MPSALPIGDPAPLDGLLPESVATGAADRNFGVYVHVPFCRVRCGYCDFNTYTSAELRGASREDYASQAVREVEFAAAVLSAAGLPDRPAYSVFFGGGTPTLLRASELGAMLAAVVRTWGIRPGAEITTEANPDSVDRDYLRALKKAGFTRVSFGMQSAVPHVLSTLERTHDPARVPDVVGWARDAGLNVSLDLIYGTPGESLEDWSTSVNQAISLEPDHISAYALIVEDGTKLAAQIRRGEVGSPDDDLQADMYEQADSVLAGAGYDWYEISNFSRGISNRSQHNLGYWRGDDWWGIGPGAHSHVGGVRWWNVKHPAAYATRIGASKSPGAGRETLSAETRQVESVMLATRLRDGLPISMLRASGRQAVAALIADQLVNAKAALAGQIELTLRGRLLADAVVRRLLE